MDARLQALNRFGLGARVAEVRQLDDPRGWLREQLRGGPPLMAVAPVSVSALRDAVNAFRMVRGDDREARQRARQRLNEIARMEAHAALAERVATNRPYVERLVAFWSNHLCVSAAAKPIIGPLAGSYERDVIRTHVLGRFEDMVLASAKHPAMLAYLDNAQSIGPNSPAARRGGRGRRPGGGSRGLNENYARELLELHTVGVNGGYGQEDVLELARILTGWSTGGLNGRGSLEFVFMPQRHEPGARRVMGKRYADDGVAQGERAIRDFCRHPSTATFVATKLVTHFAGDQPTPASIERMAAVFRKTDGNLREVANALIDLPEAWNAGTRKFRTPQDWLVAALRAGSRNEFDPRLTNALRQMRQPLWAPQAPKGFGDTIQEWSDPDSLLNRAELARTLTHRGGRQDAADAGALLEVVELSTDDPLRAMVSNRSIPAPDRIALVIAGPAFQWR